MKKSLTYWSAVVMTLLLAQPLTAQENPTIAMPLKPAKAPAKAGVLKPEIEGKLKSIRAESAKKKHAFEVGYTSAMEQKPAKLCATKRPKAVNAAAVEAQEKSNAAMQSKIQTELSADNITIQTNEAGPVSAQPSYWWVPKWSSPVKNQGNCGSCWAFAASAAFEHGHKKFYGTTPDLSEQNIVDCGRTGSGLDAGSCEEGGWSDRAFDYLRCYGTANESVSPYLGTDEACKRVSKKHYAYNWGQLYPNRFPNRNEIKRTLKKYGAVVTYMKAGVSSFYAYKSGIYNDYANTDETDIDHAVTIVGWCDEYNAWIIKNSWGTDWGYGGYAYVDYDNCNIGKYIYYVMPRHSFGRISTVAPMATMGAEKPIVTDKSAIIDASN